MTKIMFGILKNDAQVTSIKDVTTFIPSGTIVYYNYDLERAITIINGKLVISYPLPEYNINKIETEFEFKLAKELALEFSKYFNASLEELIHPDKKYEELVDSIRKGPKATAVKKLKELLEKK